MKLLLTHTYFLEDDAYEKKVMKPYPPLGILYLSAWMKKHDCDVEVFDSTFSSLDKLLEKLQNDKPDVLGIHCNLLTKFVVLKLIRYCNENNIIALLGGPDASTQVQEFLEYGADIIISGEGEDALLTVISELESGRSHRELHDIPNVSFREADGKFIQNPRKAGKRQLDDYPWPDREAIDLTRYLDVWESHHGQRSVSLITARGCAFTCKWCSHSVYGHTHRRRRPEKVVEEIRWITKTYKPTHLWYADDVFTANKRWLQKFNALMQAEGLALPFECIARADKIDDEIVQILKELGCYRVWFGAESGSQKILDAMARGVTKQQISDATRWCRKHGVESGYFVMFGYPGEELTDIYETIDFVQQQQPDKYLTTIAYPLRGTALFDEAQSDILYHNDWESHLQRELEIDKRFSRELYQFAIKKLASDYRRKQLKAQKQDFPKQVYHGLRSYYCDVNIKRLARL